jgi:FkbM family methyltransferase
VQHILGWSLPDTDNHFRSFLGQHPQNSYQQPSLDLALEHCRARSLVLDIGANIGLFAVRFSEHFDQVVCFEPTTTVYDCLRLNCGGLDNVKVHKVGLGQHNGTAEISMPESSRNCGVYSMVDFATLQDGVWQETVPVMKLDDFELSPDLIKMDVQGFEPRVLQGALTTLKRSSPVLLLEVEGTAVRNTIHCILKPLGYEPVAAARHDQIWIKTHEPADACAASSDLMSDPHGSNETEPVFEPMPLDPEDWEFRSD